jgi:hypothetical protein
MDHKKTKQDQDFKNRNGFEDKCSVCKRSFRGWEPLTDGRGNYTHKKCSPLMTREEMLPCIIQAFGGKNG